MCACWIWTPWRLKRPRSKWDRPMLFWEEETRVIRSCLYVVGRHVEGWVVLIRLKRESLVDLLCLHHCIVVCRQHIVNMTKCMSGLVSGVSQTSASALQDACPISRLSSAKWFLNEAPALLRPHKARTTIATLPWSDPNSGPSLVHVLSDTGAAGQTGILDISSLDHKAVQGCCSQDDSKALS
jgi:hypothetical protein